MSHKTVFVAVILASCFFATVFLLEDSTTAAPFVSYSKVLTNQNYDQVLRSHRIVFVKFYAPWCKFSKRFVPIWEELATDYRKNKRILLADMDCESEDVCYNVYGISKYPSLFMFHNNEKFETKYLGFRNVYDIETYIDETIANITSTY